MAESASLRPVSWPKAYRLVREMVGQINFADDIAAPGDWGWLESAERSTASLTADQAKRLAGIPAARQATFKAGDPMTVDGVMRPFHHAPASRFSDGSYGVWYGCGDATSAMAETVHHYRKFMQSSWLTNTTPSSTGYRTLIGSVDCDLHDVNGLPGALSADSYERSRRIGADLRGADSNGVVWESVRWPDGECVGLFWPDIVGTPIRRGDAFNYRWTGDGEVVVRNSETGRVFRAL